MLKENIFILFIHEETRVKKILSEWNNDFKTRICIHQDLDPSLCNSQASTL